jgi:hypothetical protein
MSLPNSSAVRIRPYLRGFPTALPHPMHGEIPALSPGTILVMRPTGVLFASTSALPSSREALNTSSENITSASSLVRTHGQSHLPLLSFGFPLVREVFAGCNPPCGQMLKISSAPDTSYWGRLSQGDTQFQAIDGEGTFTLQDSQPYRLLNTPRPCRPRQSAQGSRRVPSESHQTGARASVQKRSR